ncbi:hypothetical protein ACOJBM_12895 [Rhizobium beringeri]|uniref:hypothetical protein n=1 Tax=Rhizobium TaxID=379 RepID=UPI0018D4DF48|nr:hypothetical protein [Rhizobium leguminosarum]WSH49242.1 hypothetical protein U8Q06_13950 [Rhizobium beringeri]
MTTSEPAARSTARSIGVKGGQTTISHAVMPVSPFSASISAREEARPVTFQRRQ